MTPAALLAYKAAVAAAHGSGDRRLGWSGVGRRGCRRSSCWGYVLARLYFTLARHVTGRGAPAVVLQFMGTFGAWAIADALGLSRRAHRSRLCRHDRPFCSVAHRWPPPPGVLRRLERRRFRPERACVHSDRLAAPGHRHPAHRRFLALHHVRRHGPRRRDRGARCLGPASSMPVYAGKCGCLECRPIVPCCVRHSLAVSQSPGAACAASSP